MINLTYDKVKQIFDKKGYLFYDNGTFNLNIGFVRESDEFTNELTDTMFIAYRDEFLLRRCICLPATTKAGFSPALFNPKVVAGMRGVAVVKPNQYRGTWQFVDSYVDWLKYPYFQQIKPIDVYRDANGDKHIDKEQVQNGLFGINIHRMSGIGVLGGILNNWSEGCMGIDELNWRKILPVIRSAVKIYGINFTATLIEKSDL